MNMGPPSASGSWAAPSVGLSQVSKVGRGNCSCKSPSTARQISRADALFIPAYAPDGAKFPRLRPAFGRPSRRNRRPRRVSRGRNYHTPAIGSQRE